MAVLGFLKTLFPRTSFTQLLIVIVPIATLGYLGQKSSAATILGADNHSKIMTGLLNVLEEVDSTDAIILATTCRTVRTS